MKPGAVISVLVAVAMLFLAARLSSQAAAPVLSDGSQSVMTDAGFFDDLLRTYTPRRLCMNNEAQVVWLHVASDLLIAGAYFSIPVALVVFIRRRRDLAFNWMFLMFASFIFACGITHLFGVWSIWQSVYRLDGLVKLFTGIVSVVTAIQLWRLIPAAVALPSPQALATANDELRRLSHELEQRVENRTRELSVATDREREARTEAERANRAKDEFLATLSHELRTPLNAIVGWAHLLSSNEISGEERTKGIEVIARNARVQNQLIEDLLDMSRITSGKLRLDVRETDLAAVIEAAIETVEPAATAKSIRLHQVLDTRAGPVRGDPDRLQQVVWNLLANAVKFTPKGGRVSVILERVNSHVEISVVDTGPGISPEVIPYIFDRFRQDDSSMTRRQGGLGLGLAIVRHLVELHGGTVRVMSTGDGAGSTFVVHLPLLPVQSATDAREGRTHPATGIVPPSESFAGLLNGVKVLMVDDEADARQLVAVLLQRAGAEVRTAASVTDALSIVPVFRPHVLVSDLGMPGEDGLSFMRKLRLMPADAGGDTPSVALTAFARSEDRRNALLAGFQMHLAKPVDPAELVITVASLAGRRR